MSKLAVELARQFEVAVDEFARLVESLDASQWRLLGVNTPGPRFLDEDEGRPVNVIAYHVAAFIPRHLGSARARAAGETPTPLDARAINAREALEFVDVTPPQVLERLRAEAPAATAFIAGLSDQELARRFATPVGEMSVDDAIRRVLTGHLDAHRLSIEATIQAAGSRA